MLKNNKLLIDKDCPMCCIYGKCFTKIGLIAEETVAPYQTIDEKYAVQINMERAKTEIALFDASSATTTYGIDAMIKIVANGNTSITRILHSRFIYAFLLRLYRFISYNRKVIYPTALAEEGRICIPESSPKYRWAYILFVAIFTGIILNQYAFHINTAFGLEHNWIREYYICFGQIVWQLVAIFFIKKNKALEYLGNMSTVSMIGGILLLPVLWLNSIFEFHVYGLLAAFMLVVGIMFFEHIRRCKLLGLPLWMTVSWVTYRTVVLVVILFFIF